MTFLGRSRELGQLRTLFDQPAATLIPVSGPPGVGVSTLVRRAVHGYRSIVFRCPPLPDAVIRGALGQRLGIDAATIPTWPDLFDVVFHRAAGDATPLVVVLDDAQRLAESRARFEAPARAMLRAARAEGRTIHLVLAGHAGHLPGFEPEAGDPEVEPVRVGPLSLRSAVDLLPGSRPWEKVRAYGVFGGSPSVLEHLDPDVTVGTNVRRLLLPDSGALAERPLAWIERSVQTPTRYIALLSAMARGDADWGVLASSVPDLTRSGQVAPYLKRLEELGLIERRRSLDAAPRSRSTRYRIVDPFVAFWVRFILPWRSSERDEEIVPHYANAIRPGIRSHLQAGLPAICREHLEHAGLETVGSSAREVGSLWGPDTEIPVAAALSSGAVCYGTCLWDPPAVAPAPDATPLAELDRHIRETRYGFGRQNRQRLVFTGRAVPTWLRREVARRHDARLVDAAELVGDVDG